MKTKVGPTSGALKGWSVTGRKHACTRSALKAAALAAAGILFLTCCPAWSADSQIVLTRQGRTVVLEPYAPNIIRITLSSNHAAALAAPGYGFVGTPSMTGWTHQQDSDGYEVVRSGRMVVRIAPENLPAPHGMPLDELNRSLREHYFGGGPRGRYPFEDTISIATASGKPLLTMRRWVMIPNRPEIPSTVDGQKIDPGSRVSATFDSPAGEHYYGLGQHQQGFLDLRDHRVDCWHEYNEIGGETVCVPFMVSSRDYGLIWDNPSKTRVDLGFNLQNVWSSDVGDRVSYFVIAGDNTDEIYEGYRQLTGIAHMLPKAAYGYIQSKAIYPTQDQLLAVAKGYRDRHLPLDILVVDFLNMTKQGNLDLDPARWPDPAGMNKQLNAMGITTLLSVWPHFSPGTLYYDMLVKKGWLIHTADGKPDFGHFKDVIGPNIDTTNPEAAKWWWDAIRDRYIKPDGFDYIWLDETEPDIDPAPDFFYVGSGLRYYNVYPLFHTASVYDGFRRDYGDSRRVFSLVRASYLGAQRNGSVFWSSDIMATWDMLRRSISAGLDFTASGMPYWDTDIAGFFSPQIPANYRPAHTPLVDPSDAEDNVDGYLDYPELFVRWYEWGAFQPVMRAHGEREHNEVWAYGKQAEPILEKYLRLRYQLMPYIYSLGYHTYQTGAPYMRALFMDFPHDPNVSDIRDEYMFGPAFLVAPVTSQGATSRKVYLPAGTDWYNYWTNERVKGGQTVEVSAPIDTLPLFIRAGSIVPLGSEILSTAEPQKIASVRVYPGADGDFTLFNDDGKTYAYEKGDSQITHLHWNDAAGRLTHTGPEAWTGPDASIVNIVGR
ncbi:MAG TPA: TIM-barrel domain-containing protein [Terracidiphilus sp.]|nr:TIM-barrel domain-containing protein [Terracidiphilus sp.]